MYAHTQTFLANDCGRRIVQNSYHCYFHYAWRFATSILAHMLDSLVRVSRRGKENHFASITRASLSPGQRNITVSSVRNRPTSKVTICTDPNPCWPIWTHSASAASSTRRMRPNNTGFLRFPFNNFMYSLTLFSKFFSSFPHGTCSLSVSYQYLALDGIYHPLWAAIPNNSTRRRHEYSRMTQARTGVSPSLLPFSKGLGPGHQQTMLLQTTTRHRVFYVSCTDSHGEHFPLQSPLLRESLLVSFPPLSYMLKFRG